MSDDGRYVEVSSNSSSWIDGIDDTNSYSDLFLWDRADHSYTLVSHRATSITTTSEGLSLSAGMSPDAGFIALSSNASDLVTGISGGGIFLWSRVDGTIVRVTHDASDPTQPANDSSQLGGLVTNGGHVVFASRATNLVASVVDANGAMDAFLWDRETGTVALISHVSGSSSETAAGASYPRAVSVDGRYVALQSSAINLVEGGEDANGGDDVFLWDRADGSIRLVSHRSGSTVATGNGASTVADLSADGRLVVFTSTATDLISGGVDTNDGPDLFVWDRDTDSVSLVSHRWWSHQYAADVAVSDHLRAFISDDGSHVSFSSGATDMVAGGTVTNGLGNSYSWDRSTGSISLISHALDSTDVAADNHTTVSGISADGSTVLLDSFATNLVPDFAEPSTANVYLWDRATDSITPVSAAAASPVRPGNGDSFATALSLDGEFVVLWSYADDLVAGVTDVNETAEAFLWTRSSGELELVSRRSRSSVPAGSRSSIPCSMSGDGEDTLISSDSGYLAAPGAPFPASVRQHLYWARADGSLVHLAFDVSMSGISPAALVNSHGEFATFTTFDVELPWWYGAQLHTVDLATGAARLVSHTPESESTPANEDSWATSASADGRWIAFLSSATDLIPDGVDNNDGLDAFLWDRETGEVALVSHVPSSTVESGNGMCWGALVSADGAWVAFDSSASDLVSGGSDFNGGRDVFLWSRATGEIRLVSHASGSTSAAASSSSYLEAMSEDGRFVAFGSHAVNLVAGLSDQNNTGDAFLWDRASGEVSIVSRSALSPTTTAAGYSAPTAVSSDGGFVFFSSGANDVVPGGEDDNERSDVFRWERSTGSVVLVSHVPDSAVTTGSEQSEFAGSSPDGRFVAFGSTADDLVGEGRDTNRTGDAFLWDGETGSIAVVSHRRDSSDATANGYSSPRAVSDDGCRVAFYSTSTDMVEADHSGNYQAFLWIDGVPDVSAPAAPGLETVSVPVGTWSQAGGVELSWSGAADERCGSGVAGYSIALDHEPASAPDGEIEVPQGDDPHSTSLVIPEDGTWYVHVAACDVAGNCSEPLHVGPLLFDRTPPSAPGPVVSTSHGAAPSSDPTVDVAWQPAEDGLSGIAGYAWAFTGEDGWVCDGVLDGGAYRLATTSNPLGSGSWWFHVCALDHAGLAGPVASAGPFTVDLDAPTVAWVSTTADTGDGVLDDRERTAAPITQLRVQLSEAMDPATLTDAGSWRLVGDGGDGVVTTPGCAGGVDPEDEPLAIDCIEAAGASVVLTVGGVRGLAAGHAVLLGCEVLTDLAGNPLDGDGDGLGGGDLRRELVVTSTGLLTNPNFDVGLEGWLSTVAGPSLQAGSTDADGIPSSGAVEVDFGDSISGFASLRQCLELESTGFHLLDLAVRLDGGDAGDPVVRLDLEPSTAPSCVMPLGGGDVELVAGPTVGWERVSAGWNAPADAASVLLRLDVSGSSGIPAVVLLDRVAFGASSLLFADDFESGDVDAWSGVLP